jgi:hypothetical protein
MDGTHPVANAQITETFAPANDPYHVGSSVRRGTYRTDRQGIFDDMIGFATKQELPDDFVLAMNQEILANGTVVAQNLVRWSVSSIMVQATDGRRPRSVAARVTLH